MFGMKTSYQGKQYDPNDENFQLGRGVNNSVHRAGAINAGRRQATNVVGQTIDKDPQAQFRDMEAGLAKGLQERVAGNKPSVAEAQMERGLAKTSAALNAQKASSRGMSPAMAQRLASQGVATAGAEVNAEKANLRAQEQTQAEQTLAGVAAGARGQDIGLATSQAGMTQQANLANQSAGLQQTGLNDALVGMHTNAGIQREGLQLNANTNLEGIKSQQQIAENQGRQAVADANANRNAQLVGAGIGAIGAGGAALLSDEREKKNVKDIDGVDLQALYDTILKSKNPDAMFEASKMAKKIEPKKFEYKDPETAGATEGEQVGVMAQDLAKTKAGRTMVAEGSDGRLRVDPVKAIGPLLAFAAEQNARTTSLKDELDEALKRLKK